MKKIQIVIPIALFLSVVIACSQVTNTIVTTTTIPTTTTSSTTTTSTTTTIAPKYAVSFETNGGSSVNPIVESRIIEIPVSTKSAYALEGWFSNSSFTPASKIGFPYVPTSNITVYAKWISATEGLQFKTNGDGYSVSKGTANTSGRITIPEFWLGKSVINIGMEGFSESEPPRVYRRPAYVSPAPTVRLS
jgi:hypothetical protein